MESFLIPFLAPSTLNLHDDSTPAFLISLLHMNNAPSARRGRKTLAEIKEQIARKLDDARAAEYIRKQKIKEKARLAKQKQLALAKSKSAPQLERGQGLDAAEARLSNAMANDGLAGPASPTASRRHGQLVPLEMDDAEVRS